MKVAVCQSVLKEYNFRANFSRGKDTMDSKGKLLKRRNCPRWIHFCEFPIRSFITLSSHQNVHEAFSSANLNYLLGVLKIYFISCSNT